MNIMAVDDERRALRLLENALAVASPEASIHGFLSTEDALAYAQRNPVDVAFLDILMGGMNGLILAKRLKEIRSTTNIIFVTGYSEYAGNAFAMYASGYVMKPVSPERIVDELKNLRNPVITEKVPRVRIQCFGSFAVFVDGVPLPFTRAKPRELFAYLVHRKGAPITNSHIAAVLWEDQPHSLSVQSNTRNVIAQLTQLLKDVGIADILCKARNSTAINIEKVSCDYYDYLRGKAEAVNAYTGEYMSDFSWGEFIVASLEGKHK